jgi:hypothetical protein
MGRFLNIILKHRIKNINDKNPVEYTLNTQKSKITQIFYI